MLLSAGIDDTATERKASEGWGFIVIPEDNVSKLQREAARLSQTPFHGSRVKKRNIRKYEKFLTTIRDVVASDSPSLLAHVFDDPIWHTDLKEISQTVVSLVQPQCEERVEAALNYVFPPLLTLQRITAKANMTTAQTEVWLDECGQTQGFAEMKVDTPPSSMSAVAYSKALYNGYRRARLPAASEMAAGGLHVLPDEQSILIQAADVFGNFAAAYAAWKLGGSKDIWRLKGEAFERVFDSPDLSKVAPGLSLKDGLEISLENAGVLELVIS